MEINNFTGISAARQFYQQLPLMQWSEDLLERMRNIATRWIKMTDIKSNPPLVDRIISVFVPANSSSAATGIGTAPSPFFLTMLTVTAIFLLSTLAFNFFKRKEAFEKNEKLLEDLALAVECNRVEAWFDMHPDQTYPLFSQLSTSQQLKAAALLVQIENPERLRHWTSVLSDDLREFQSWLSNKDPLSTSDTFLQQFTPENRAIALALKVNKNKIRIQYIRGNINDELLLQMAPTLRYLDLENILDDSLVLKLIRNCPNVYRLYIDSYHIENLPLPALPLCQTLTCSECRALTALPELPMCQTLVCWLCSALTALPELPPAVRVFSDDTARTHYERWEINFQLFAENPKQLLRDLDQKYLLRNRPLPNIDYLVNDQRSEAIDVGGVQRIEGELNSDLLLSKLQWDQSSPAVSQDNLNKTQGFLAAWIRAASDERLRLFVRTVSGSNSLSFTPLQMQAYNRGSDYLPVAHTCFFALELSAEYPEQTTFNQKLEWLLTEGMAQGGFQII